MCKAALAIFVLAVMVNIGTRGAELSPLASWPPGVDWQSTAKPAVNPDPPECLYLETKSYTLEGRLGGVAIPADSQEIPPIEAHSFIYFFLDKPISVCASKESLGKAWINVTRLAIGVYSNEFYRYLVKYWGQWGHVRVVATTLIDIDTALPGPVGISDFSKICFRAQYSGNTGSQWWCIPARTWGSLFKESPQWINNWH